MKAADQPQYKKDHNQEAQHPAQASATIAPMSIIPTTAAKQNNDDYDQ
jgi:hypothetical protein